MKLYVIIYIAILNLTRRFSRTIVTVGGVSLAIALVIFFMSLGYGLEKLVVDEFSNLYALRSIDVSAEKSEQINIDNDSLKELAHMPNVELVKPIIEVGAEFLYESSVTDVAVISLDSETLELLATADLADESVLDTFGGKEIIVSEGALDLVGAGEDIVGNDVELTLSLGAFIPEENGSPTEIDPEVTDTFRIITVEKSADFPVVYVPIGYLKTLGVDRYSVAKLLLNDTQYVRDTQILLEKEGYTTRSTLDTIEQVEDIFVLIRLGLGSFGIVASIVATFGMFNTLTVSLLEKMREIGILKIMGASKKTVLQLLWAESLVIAVLGSTLGILMGVLGSEILQSGLSSIAQLRGEHFGRIFEYPPLLLISVFAGSVVVGMLTGLYPARRASQLNPLDALRFE